MIVWIKGLIAKLKHAKQVRFCKKYGHKMAKRGEGREHDAKTRMPIGPIELWICGCACGYSEIVPINTGFYTRSWEDGLKFIEEQSGEKNPKG